MSDASKRRWLRFSTRTMLVVMAIVAAFLGYAQWRRQTIMREAAALNSQGFTLLWRHSWIDWIWPQAPSEAAFEYYREPGGKYRTASGVYTSQELEARYVHACDRLRALGVKTVRLDLNGKPSNSHTPTLFRR
jgi:hypothetical protein